jgi:hypothetical protein
MKDGSLPERPKPQPTGHRNLGEFLNDLKRTARRRLSAKEKKPRADSASQTPEKSESEEPAT